MVEMCNNRIMSNEVKISIIVPSFNEQDNIKLLFEHIKTSFKDVNFEVIFIDDGSKDNTFAEIKQLLNKKNNIIAVRFSRNFGKESAIYAGLERARGEYICFIDADMQQDPKYSLQMMNMLEGDKDIDCVCAIPKNRKDNYIMSTIKNMFYKMINNLSEVPFEKNASDFRVFRSCIKDALLSIKEKSRFSKGLFSWIGFKTKYIEYEVKQRNSGSTKWSFIKLLKYASSGIVSFSTTPLFLSIYIGIILFILGIVLLIIDIINPLIISVNTLLVLLTVFISFVLLVIGIIGIYLSGIYIQVKNRPIYIVKEEIK